MNDDDNSNSVLLNTILLKINNLEDYVRQLRQEVNGCIEKLDNVIGQVEAVKEDAMEGASAAAYCRRTLFHRCQDLRVDVDSIKNYRLPKADKELERYKSSNARIVCDLQNHVLKVDDQLAQLAATVSDWQPMVEGRKPLAPKSMN